ncbi:MAG: glycosyltransferase family 87 protein [Planctomycetota bacterium]
MKGPRLTWQGGLYALVSLAVWVPLLARAMHKLEKRNDFEFFHGAAQALWSGQPLYGTESAFMYPPLFAYLLLPLAPLPYYVAGLLWLFLKVPLFYFSAAALLPREGLAPQLRTRLLVFSPLLVYRFLDSDLANGNSNIYLLAGIAMALRLAEQGKDALAGGMLSVVAAVKLAPAYLAACLLGAGRWRITLWLLWFLPLFLVVPALPLTGGFQEAWRGFHHTSRAVFAVAAKESPSEPGGGYLPGQSLRPILHRWLTPSDATAHAGGRVVTINVVSWSSVTVERLYLTLALLLALAGVALSRGQSLHWSFAWGALLMLLISPYSRKAHFLLLLPALLIVVQTCLAGGVRRPRILGASLCISMILGQLSTPAIWGKAGAALLLGGGVVGGAAMAILHAMWIIRCQNHEP